MCGILRRCLYGTRDAGKEFELFSRRVMVDELGFEAGLWNPCVYRHTSKDMQAYIYGDNFVAKCSRDDGRDFHERLKQHMWVKLEGVLGPNRSLGDVREVRCLNRIFRWCPESGGRPEAVEIEADPRHAQILISQSGLSSTSKPVVTPGVKQDGLDDGETLEGEDATQYRSMVMRGSYLAEDRPDIRFASKEAARFMSSPTSTGITMVKRIARFLLGVPRLVQRMERQRPQSTVLGYSDSDFAGCRRTRKSTSCSVLMHGNHMIKLISATQAPISLSTGEAEWYALTRTGSAVIGLINMAADYGRKVTGELAGDATAAAGIAARRGVGKIRHLDVSTLWLQNRITEGSLVLKRKPGSENPSDLGTKHLDRKTMRKHVATCGFIEVQGASDLALEATLS